MVLLQTQSTAGAALEIIVMLLGAALIGVFTTYFYMRSRNRKTIESLQSRLNSREAEIGRLEKETETLRKELANQEGSLKELQEKEEELEELEELLKQISERKHMINYSRIGTARREDMDDLRMISGIGPKIEKQLHALDIYTYEQISKFTKEDIEAVTEVIQYFPGRIEKDEWISQAKELIYTKGKESELLKQIAKRKDRINYDRIGIAHKEDAQDLTAIHGIGGWIQQKLYALDIFTYQQIAKFSEEDILSVTDVLEYFPGRIERDEWVAQARKLSS